MAWVVVETQRDILLRLHAFSTEALALAFAAVFTSKESEIATPVVLVEDRTDAIKGLWWEVRWRKADSEPVSVRTVVQENGPSPRLVAGLDGIVMGDGVRMIGSFFVFALDAATATAETLAMRNALTRADGWMIKE